MCGCSKLRVSGVSRECDLQVICVFDGRCSRGVLRGLEGRFKSVLGVDGCFLEKVWVFFLKEKWV